MRPSAGTTRRDDDTTASRDGAFGACHKEAHSSDTFVGFVIFVDLRAGPKGSRIVVSSCRRSSAKRNPDPIAA
jgi:hypothetical protein